MPYIVDPSDRVLEAAEAIGRLRTMTEGELNYLMSECAAHYLRLHGLKYATCDQIAGAYKLSAAEFERRIVNPYEDTKMAVPGAEDPWAEWES